MVISNFGLAQTYGVDEYPPTAYALSEIKNSYGIDASVAIKAKAVDKFGKNNALGTSKTMISEIGANEVWLAIDNNAISHISSSNAGDTQLVVVEGHYGDGQGNLIFHLQTVTLTGQTPVALSQPCSRVSRMRIAGTTAPAGDVWAHENLSITAGVPSNLASAHAVIKGTLGQNKTFKLATSTSYRDCGIITNLLFSVSKKTAGSADFEVQFRRNDELFEPIIGVISLSTTSNESGSFPKYPYLIIPPNSDIRVMATGSTTNMEAHGTFQMMLAIDKKYAQEPV